MPQKTVHALRCLECFHDFIGPNGLKDAMRHHDRERHRVVGTVTTHVDMDATDASNSPRRGGPQPVRDAFDLRG